MKLVSVADPVKKFHSKICIPIFNLFKEVYVQRNAYIRNLQKPHEAVSLPSVPYLYIKQGNLGGRESGLVYTDVSQ